MSNVISKNFDIELPLTTVRVYFAHFQDISHKIEAFLKILSKEELNRVNWFKFSEDRIRFIYSRAILRILSGRYLDMDPNMIKFKYNEYGKPSFYNCDHLEFNLSHSGNMVILAFVKENQIGVDIEQIKYNFDCLSIANNFFSDQEINQLQNIPKNDQKIAFYRCWTRKEAFIKAEGSGLSFPLTSFSVSLDSDSKAELIETNWSHKENKAWSLYSYRPTSEYISAIAVRGKMNSIEYIDLNKYLFQN
ncbi:4'-phosphopantetheinyl transferase superfamily protein [Arenibacter sp. F26102]|uniref:4'-phosphopantetheinyl transferase family protein n=1 Tax=Arenibacter sp. F26102 TaxID=2926416 RepID=UPI001FF17F9B|nr:4'-phosphopantetheinyl transferase superfamily protein [Arenibacter sp. F26102]MCK0148124.1 4'-phosphopantetheinyl transferase superfamily protein [Arenibacter sp. F26102]